MAEKLGHFDALQEAARIRFERENAQAKAGLDRVMDTFQRWWNPKLAQERDARARAPATGDAGAAKNRA